MKELLTYIVENLVSDPAAIAITEEIDGDNITYSLRVAPGDMGRVIGRHGRIAKEIQRGPDFSEDTIIEVMI